MKEARKIFAFREANKNSPVLQQMLKMLSSWPYALGTVAEDVYSLEFSEVAEMLRRMLLVLTECEDLNYTL